MSKKNYLLFFILAIVLVPCSKSWAQYAAKKVKSKHQLYTDSLKNVTYNYVLPILGQVVYKRGFDIPYPIGIMNNFIVMNQGILIDNMQLGFQNDDSNIPLTPVDFIEFGNNSNKSFSTNIRPDIWVLPFLNVYGLFGVGKTRTEISLKFPVEMTSVVEQKLTTTGFGVMGAGGVGPVWFSVDANFTWNKPELLDKATQVNVMGMRIGHTFVFKMKPERNIAIWGGAMRVKMSTVTSGAIKMADALPPEAWDRKDEIVSDYWAWYDDLNPITDAGKILVADEVLTPIVEGIDARDGSSIISYSMDKQTKQLWNGLIGMQFQFNKRWMLRSEVGLIGDRKSLLFSANYRFFGMSKKMEASRRK